MPLTVNNLPEDVDVELQYAVVEVLKEDVFRQDSVCEVSKEGVVALGQREGYAVCGRVVTFQQREQTMLH